VDQHVGPRSPILNLQLVSLGLRGKYPLAYLLARILGGPTFESLGYGTDVSHHICTSYESENAVRHSVRQHTPFQFSLLLARIVIVIAVVVVVIRGTTAGIHTFPCMLLQLGRQELLICQRGLLLVAAVPINSSLHVACRQITL
jgi:hypothetical protein